MRAAAARASARNSSPTPAARASAAIASASPPLRDAIAAASAVPQRSPSLRAPPLCSTAWRLRRMSRASSGICARTDSSFVTMAPRSGRLQGLLARLPVARAELVRLQSIQDAQHLVHTATDRQVVHRDVADDPLRVDDERRA